MFLHTQGTKGTLVSVQALCVNDAVLRLGSLSRINERCLELRQAKPKKQATAAPKQKPKVPHHNLSASKDVTLHLVLEARCQTWLD